MSLWSKTCLICLSILMLLAGLEVVWPAFVAVAQEPNEEAKDIGSFTQLPPPKIELAGRIGGTVNNSWAAWNVMVAGDMAYVGAGDGLRLINISVPARPAEAGFYPMSYAGEVVLIGNVACVLNAYSVRFVNIVNPAAPYEVGFYTFPFSQYPDSLVDVAVLKNIAYLARYDTGLYLLDISNLSAPTLIGSYDSPQQTYGLAVAENKVYLAGGQSGLYIADTSDPTMPVEVGSHPGLMGWSNDVAAVGDRVYLADGLFGFGGLSIIDTAKPTCPKMIGSIDLGDARHVTVLGEYAYMIVDDDDLHIVNITRPGRPIEVGFYDIDVTWWIDDLDVKNNYVYVAAQDDGLLILRLFRYKITNAIFTEGGSLPSPGGDTYLDFPSGAITQSVVLTYRHLWQDQDVGHLIGVGHTFELEMVYPSDQPFPLAPGQTFYIWVQYTDAETGPAIEDTLALYYWNGSQWVRESSSVVDVAQNIVTARPNHWATLWAVLGETQRTFLPTISKK